MNTCATCKHSGDSYIYRPVACFRSKRFKSGSMLKAPYTGFSCDLERGHPDIYEGRADQDCCGVDGAHWEAK